MNTPTHLLVLGTPRSGTSLLAAMIGRHSDVAMLYEDFGRSVHNLVGKRVVANKLCVPNQIEMERARPRWVRPLGPRVFRRLHRWGYFGYRPESLTSIQDYLAWEPLRVVAIVREAPAVVASIMKRGGQPWDVAAYRWARGMELLDELDERLGEAMLTLTFSNLVLEPEGSMRAVADHIGVPFEAAMLDGYAYTPHYSNPKIDRTKAAGPTGGEAEAKIEQAFPEAFVAYRRLRTLSPVPTAA